MPYREPFRRPPRRNPAPSPPAAQSVAPLLALGNQAVGRLLARQAATATDLPPTADYLKSFRAGEAQLQALGPAPAGTDLAQATAWMGQLVAVLSALGDAADASNLLFESTVVSGRDGEYGHAESVVREKVGDARRGAQALGERLRAHVVDATNRSSVVGHGRADNPDLGTKEQALAWRAQTTAFYSAARSPELREAAAVCEDSALALLQARSVAEARETWRAGTVQSTPTADVESGTRARTELDDVFADSGWNNRQSLHDVELPDGTTKKALDDWCGMFAAANMYRAAELDPKLRMAFAHTDNVNDFFQYTASVNPTRTPKAVWADGEWILLRDYHEKRGSVRRWIVGPAASADIRPGDIALIRHAGTKPAKAIANHIVMVESYDAATGTLTSIEGNVTEGLRPDATGEAERTAGGELKSTTTPTTSTVVEVRDMNDETTLTPGAAADGTYRNRGHKTVYAVGRPSLVDFETHDFAEQLPEPQFRHLSPADIHAHAKLVTSSTHSDASGPYHKRVD